MTKKPLKLTFIWSKENKEYLGVYVSSNDCDVALSSFNTPHAFSSAEAARRCLQEDTPWYNSSLEQPMRKKFNLDNCEVVELELPLPKEIKS